MQSLTVGLAGTLIGRAQPSIENSFAFESLVYSGFESAWQMGARNPNPRLDICLVPSIAMVITVWVCIAHGGI
jgi:hypothetical protein